MNEKLLQMAREAGFVSVRGTQGGPSALMCGTDELARFAELVRADEREKCAKVCDEKAATWHQNAVWASPFGSIQQMRADSAREVGDAIRARGKQEKV